jgi:amino acid transporter
VVLASLADGFALQLVAAITISSDGTWTPPYGVVYVIFLACVLLHGTLATVLARFMGRIQSWTVLLNLVLVVGTIIALPIGTARQGTWSANSGSYIFAQVENLTTWSTGWAFVLAWLSPIWTISCFDSCVHMAEEASNAAVAVPWGIVMATTSSWVLGFVVLIVICASIDPDLANVLGTSFGQPMAQIYYDALGKHGALGFMALLLLCQFFMGLSILVACSRQSWAFCRDGALPFSSFFRVVDVHFGWRVPTRTIRGSVLLAAVMGLLCLIATAAANALFSLLIIGNNMAYIVPILCRAVWGRDKFVPGRFYTGKASLPIAWFAIFFLLFGLVGNMCSRVAMSKGRDHADITPDLGHVPDRWTGP